MRFRALTGLFSSKGAKETKAEAQERQNRWIKAKEREWQLAWNDLFDQDPGQPTADNAAKGDSIPDRPSEDYRLIFGLSEVTAQTRAGCFALLPEGAEVARRFEQFMQSRNKDISEDEALALVKRIAAEIAGATVYLNGDWSDIRVVDREDDAAQAELELEYRVHDLFEGSLLEPCPEEKLEALAASLFLTEPLYANAGNYYQPGQWISGVYMEPAQDRCLGLVYELWLGGWDVLVGAKGVGVLRLRNR